MAVADVASAEFGGFAGRDPVHSAFGDVGGDRIGVGVRAFFEQRFHLCFADLGASLTAHTSATSLTGTERAPVDSSDASPEPTQWPGDRAFAE